MDGQMYGSTQYQEVVVEADYDHQKENQSEPLGPSSSIQCLPQRGSSIHTGCQLLLRVPLYDTEEYACVCLCVPSTTTGYATKRCRRQKNAISLFYVCLA